MVDSGYTFSPLTPEYANNGESCETLVTHVACLGDMGGWMSHGHPVEQLLRIFGASSARLSSFLRPLINHNIALRNKVGFALFNKHWHICLLSVIAAPCSTRYSLIWVSPMTTMSPHTHWPLFRFATKMAPLMPSIFARCPSQLSAGILCLSSLLVAGGV